VIKSSQKNTPKNGPVAPDFTLRSREGREITLSSYKGKVIYIKFWASWCGDCIKQVVPQRHLEEELKTNSNLVFINISVDTNEEAWKKAVVRNKLKAIELISNGGQEGNVNELYGIDEIPRYVLIGKDGKIIEDHAPFPSELDINYFKDYL